MNIEYCILKAKATGVRTLISLIRSNNPPKLYNEEIQIPSRDNNRTIRARVYNASKKSTSTTGKGPALLNFHGSGFILRAFGEDAEFCDYIAQNSSYTVFDCSYRLAPEDPYPAALNDVEDATRWVISQGYDMNRIALSGFSAGACLSLAAASAVFEPGEVHTVLAFYPPTDLSLSAYDKKAPNTAGRTIPPAMAVVFDQCYIPRGVDPKTPGISPAYADPARFPENLLLITCEIDTLCDEGEKLAARISKGRNLVQKRMINCPHAWDKRPVGAEQKERRDESYKMALDMLVM